MPEEITTPLPEETVTETPITPAEYFGNDGTLKDGWQSTLPDGYKEEKSLSTVKDAKVLAKMFVDTKRMVGRDVMALPTDTSSAAEWEAYYKAGGRPETVADYNLAAPEGFPTEYADMVFPSDRMGKWQERFFDSGISKKAADKLIAAFAEDSLADIRNQQQEVELANQELVNGLSSDWGAAFEQNKHLGNMAIEEGTLGNAEFKERITGKFGNDPDFVRYSANLGKKFAEGKPPSYTAIPTSSDLKDQIETLMSDPLYMKGTQTQRMKIADKIMALRIKMYPE